MECKEVQNLLLETEITPEIEKHLRRCVECTNFNKSIKLLNVVAEIPKNNFSKLNRFYLFKIAAVFALAFMGLFVIAKSGTNDKTQIAESSFLDNVKPVKIGFVAKNDSLKSLCDSLLMF